MLWRRKIKFQQCLAVGLCVVIIGVAAGCQKSPQSSIVVNKDLDKMIEQAENKEKKGLALDQEYDTYKTTIEDKSLGVKVNVDAKVDVPKTDKMSLFRIKQQKFTQGQIDAVRKELLGDIPLYDGAVLKKKTKKEIEEQIAALRSEMKQFEHEDSVVRSFQKQIDKLEEEYQSATVEASMKNLKPNLKLETVTKKYNEDPSDSFYSWLYSFSPEGEIFNGITDGKNGKYSRLYVWNDEYYSNYLTFNTGTKGYERAQVLSRTPDNISKSELIPLPGEKASISLEEAVEIADGFLKNTGINSEVSQFRFYEGELTTEQINMEKEEGGDRTSAHVYYVLTYMRDINGVSITSSNLSKANYTEMGKGGDVDKMFWPTEKIEFRINDSGIVGFDYWAPLVVTETVVDNSTMKTFDEVCDIFEKMSVIVHASEHYNVQIDIDRIVLGYAQVSEPDSYSTGLLVPVWDFIGSVTRAASKDGIPRTEENISCLTINAIDGSIVDRELGY